MANKKTEKQVNISFKLKGELADRIESYKSELGISYTDMCIKGLERQLDYLDGRIKPPQKRLD